MEHERMLRLLGSSDAYPFETSDVEVIQTGISSVILAGPWAYKIKKPVRLDFLDFTTLEKRLYFCEREVRLNRRLAPDVYLGVVPVSLEDGKLRMEGEDSPIEYAVKMHRLPQDRMMNLLLEGERVSPEVIDDIASRVADFHRRAGTGPDISSCCTQASLKNELEDDLRQVSELPGKPVPGEVLESISSYLLSWVDGHAGLLAERVDRGRIRDCHGDMHSGNICLPGGVEIFDCIEFNDLFRYIDVAREVAFLAMDLDSYDQSALAGRYVEAYVELSGDAVLPELLDFYKAWLAVVRGKVYSIPPSGEVSPGERKHSVFKARRYFDLAHRYAGGRERPLVLVMMGAMGSGKSALAQVLAKDLYFHMLDSDYVRKTLAGIEPEERRKVGFGEDIYSDEMTDRVYAALADATVAMTAEGYSLIVEASFSKARHRRQVMDAARSSGARILFVYCTADISVLEERLVKRERGGRGYSDGRLQLLPRQLELFEAPLEVPATMMMELDTDRPLDELAVMVLERIRREYGAGMPEHLSLRSSAASDILNGQT